MGGVLTDALSWTPVFEEVLRTRVRAMLIPDMERLLRSELLVRCPDLDVDALDQYVARFPWREISLGGREFNSRRGCRPIRLCGVLGRRDCLSG